MKTCLLTSVSDSLTYTLAKAIGHNGHEVIVWVANAEADCNWDWSLSRHIAAIPGVTVAETDRAAPPEHIDRLLVQINRRLHDYHPAMGALAPAALRITLITLGDRRNTPRQSFIQQWIEWRWSRQWAGKIDRVAYKDGFHRHDWWGLWKPRRVVGFDAHSKFLQDPGLFHALHARDWDVEARRPTLVNFLGSRDPNRRARILDSVEAYFTTPGASLQQYHPGKRMHWLAYTDEHPAALGAQEFLTALTDSDFTLAPPGYSLVTHRPVEALLRGSIPVLNAAELDLYDLGLVDGVNCIAVPTGGWTDAMERILAMDEADIRRMRRHILAMLAEKVDYAALSRDICRRLGVEGE